MSVIRQQEMLMKKNEPKEHPEVKDIKNICDIAPNTKTTKKICAQLKKNKK
jgi:hypothetical protein